MEKGWKLFFQNREVKIVFSLVMLFIIIILFYLLVRELVANTQIITNLAKSAGVFGPIVLILLLALGILFSPVPSIALIVLAGYLYGPLEGAIYSYIGHLIAATGTFLVVRKFKIKTKDKKYKKYQNLIEGNKDVLYLFYVLPIIPISITSIFSAFTKIKFKKFLKIILISFIPLILLFSFFGDVLNNRDPIEIFVSGIIILVAGFFLFRKTKKKVIKNKN